MVELETLSQSTFAPDRPVRPPTPPRESTADEPRPGAFNRVFGTAKRLFRRTSSFTNITPQSSAEPPNTHESTRKKVEWADLPAYNDVPSFTVEGNQIFSSPVQPLPPSAERKTPKSILKSRSYSDLSLPASSLHSNPVLTTTRPTFARMLESSTQQLAGGDRGAKVDAYMTLSRVLKGADNVVDSRVLKPKMELLLSFIKRDINEKGEEGRPETSLALNALVLLCSFFHTSHIADLIPLEFVTYIVDLSIKTLEDSQASKDIARHLMFILAKQTFPPRVMNQERVAKLLNALNNIDAGNLAGKRIMDGRINIYRTLIRQSRGHMISNPIWLDNLFADMTSRLKETRINGITLGLEAAFSLGIEVKMTKALSILFQSEIGDKGKYGQLLIDRLKQMTQTDSEKDPSAPAAVPQIWSVVILLFRGRLQALEKWEFLSQWLTIISNSFNGSDVTARKEALLAWNRFIFVVHSNESATGSMSGLIKLLPQALEAQLRRGNLRTQTINTLCCLLYYSLKSTNTTAQYDTYWNDYVVRLVGRPLSKLDPTTSTKKSSLTLTEACTILKWLFDIESKRNWNQYRIQENDFPATELSPLDTKWVRKSANIVFPVIETLLERLYWDLGTESEVNHLWSAYIKSISAPAVMEIKVSNDSMTSLAAIFGFLHKVWRAGPQSIVTGTQSRPVANVSDSAAFLKSFESLMVTLLDGFGTLPFTERQLGMGTQDIFTPIATPSQNPSKLRGEARTPLHHLVVLLSSLSPNLEYDSHFAKTMHRIFEPFFSSRKTKAGSVDLAKTLLEYLPAENTEPCRIIWQVVANVTTTLVDTRDTDGKNRDQPVGAIYKDLVKILDFGITLARNEITPRWKSLFDAVACSAVLDAGDSGKAIAVIEPLAASLLRKSTSITPLARLLHFSTLVGKASYPKNKQALDSASKKLWGALSTAQRNTSFDPFVHLYDAVSNLLETGYTTYDNQKSHIYIDMIEATSNLLARCPAALCLDAITKFQDALALWILDKETKFSSGDELSATVLSSWSRIGDQLCRLLDDQDHSKLLLDHENILCSALESRHKSVVNSAIKIWNTSFGLSSQIVVYPERLRSILLRLRTATEIHLPSLPASLISEEMINDRQPFDFDDTRFDFGSPLDLSGLSPALRLSNKTSPLHRPQVSSARASLRKLPLKRMREETPPEAKERKSRKHDITPKARHENSQIQFQTIDSSPIVNQPADSQMLTDRQKEVRERQKADAAIFQNICSSPRRRQSIDESDQELPTRRSSSQLRTHSRERKATPTLVPPSDDDDGFVASSPTPTRSIRSEVADNSPPSSPPHQARDTVEPELDDVPSSPPEQPEEPEITLLSSLAPSGQVDPHAVQQQHVVSTYGSTVDFGAVSASTSAPTVEKQIQMGLHPMPRDGHEELKDVNPQVEGGKSKAAILTSPVEQIDETILETPDTPLRISRPEILSTPKTTKDAPANAAGSPVSSDIFEDAVSSPRLNVEKTASKPTSSELTDLDESSVLRALAEADATEKLSQDVIEVGHLPSTRTLQRKSTAQVILSRSGSNQFQIEETPAPRQTRVHRPQSPSSIPSRIPETPGCATISGKKLMEIQSLSPEETIVVGEDAMYEEVQTGGGKKKKKEKKFLELKRKFDVDEVEIGDSQRSAREGSSQSSVSSGKKPRGRPRKYPRPNEEPALDLDTAFGLGRHQSQELISETKEGEILPVPDVDVQSKSVQNSEEQHFETTREVLESLANADASSISRLHGQDDVILIDDEMDVIEETRILTEVEVEAASSASDAVAIVAPTHRMKTQLQALMDEMEDAALSKEELDQFEDMFEEAKCLLFAARMRGRKGGL